MERKLDLAGVWKFSLGDAAYGDTIPLPGTTAMAKKGKENDREETGFLTERYPYTGRAYFARTVTLPEGGLGKRLILFLERTRMTRVWVDGVLAGTGNSLTAPHRFDLTEYVKKRQFELEIEVANTGYPTSGGHMTSPDTQTNWMGIMGRMELQVCGPMSVQSVRTTCRIEQRTMTLDCEILSDLVQAVNCAVKVQPEALWLSGLIGLEGKNYEVAPETLPLGHVLLPPQSTEITVKPGKNRVSVSYSFDDDAVLWSEHTPVVYKMHVSLVGNGGAAFDHYDTFAALRAFAADGHDFLINGMPTKLRGKHDGMLFPLTGAAPMDVGSWIKAMGRAWQYGINHYRYHTSCPPDAAFLAADLLGIYMEPELPFWGTIAAPGEEGFREEEQEYLMEEGVRMLSEYGNHPSYCMMSLGNELWGSKARVNGMVGRLKGVDDRPLYTQGSCNFQFIPEILPNDDFFVAVRLAPPVNGENRRLIRGSFAMCDAPLGPVQTMAPNTRFDFDAAVMPEPGTAETGEMDAGEVAIQYGTGVKLVKAEGGGDEVTASVPVVAHEIGQYSMFPNFKEIPKYTGVLDARNMKVFARRLADAGMADRGEEFFRCAGKFAVECYREELEMMHRSRYLAGYQILDLQDYTGQGTSLVGILDSFLDSKGLVEPDMWRGYSSDEVLLGCFDKYVYTEGEAFAAEVRLSFFNPMRNLEGKQVQWGLYADGKKLRGGALPIGDSWRGTVSVGGITCAMPSCEETGGQQRLSFLLEIPGTPMRREYTFWLYPDAPADQVAAGETAGNVLVSEDAKEAWSALCGGRRVLFFPRKLRESVPGFYCTDFWNYSMFRQISENMGREVAVGTLGLCIQKEHPALAGFACEEYSTPQWYSVVSGSGCAVLDSHMPPYFKPIVQMIDNVERNHKLGILFEEACGAGRLLVCTARLDALRATPEGRQFFLSILRYSESEAFLPESRMEQADFDGMFGGF